MPPHGGIGAAPERIVYGILGLDHIMYTKAFPRYPDRKMLFAGNSNPWKNEQITKLFEKYKILEK